MPKPPPADPRHCERSEATQASRTEPSVRHSRESGNPAGHQPPPTIRGSAILLATIGRPHGVRGLVRVTSYASPPEALARYTTLHVADGRRFSLRWRGDGIAELTDLATGPIRDRTAAERLTNLPLYVDRDQLPAPDDDEFYVTDLIGLAAISADGTPLGRIATIHDYGAGASLETETGLLVPFTRAAVPAIDLAAGRVTIAAPDTLDAVP